MPREVQGLMPCGVTRVTNGVTITCDNAGTSTHAGLHSGLLNYTFFGRVWSSTRVYWSGAVSRVVAQKPAVLGESDFVMPSNQGTVTQVTGITGAGTAAIDETTPIQIPGPYTFDPESNWNYLDYIICGSGGGGHGGNGGNGQDGYGGRAGTWLTGTLTKGTHIHAVPQISGVLGDGGAGSPSKEKAGYDGEATTFTYLDPAGVRQTITVPGGLKGPGYGTNTGLSPGNQTYNGVTYEGGATAGEEVLGKAPGGGGGGGHGGLWTDGGPGKKGGRAQIWFRVRT
ncbi:hypothetical protein MYRNA_113 [Mycobacterium phage Myrna]|uniref:Glycine-rich domain-containing protein n=1 Tax=Mycobacterium phage Myrna TaxID=546805 RepID=B5LJB7_9CAUD|nr:gp113 [Mycobacterium phage Myrna]ACH62114.1 hypothetical protein MYRNA_113 [Mycobacterium phage Myrna]